MKTFRRIRPSLCLMVLLQLTAVTSDLPSIVVREGEDVTLPSGLGDQDTCDDVAWLKSLSNTVNLVSGGQVKPGAWNSDRLTLTANCSLVIKKVTPQDVDLYSCQLVSSGRDTQFPLSVVSMSHHEEHESVTLTCSALAPAPDSYRLRVKWVYESEDKPKTEISGEAHSATVRFPSASFKQRSAYRCEVTDSYKNTKQLFGFSPQSTEPGEDEIRASTTEPRTEPPIPTEGGGLTASGSIWTTLKDWWLYMVAAGVSVVVVVTVVLIIRWRRTKGRKETQEVESTELSLNPTAPPQAAAGTSPDTEDPEEEVPYASVSYAKKKSGSEAQVDSQTLKTPDGSDSVTYSTLRASPPPPAAEHSSIYATVRKNTTQSSS